VGATDVAPLASVCAISGAGNGPVALQRSKLRRRSVTGHLGKLRGAHNTNLLSVRRRRVVRMGRFVAPAATAARGAVLGRCAAASPIPASSLRRRNSD